MRRRHCVSDAHLRQSHQLRARDAGNKSSNTQRRQLMLTVDLNI